MAAELAPEAGPHWHFATTLRKLRKSKGLTQVQLREAMLARGINIPQGMLSAYERAKSGISDERTSELEDILDGDGQLWAARRRDADSIPSDASSIDSPGWMCLPPLTAITQAVSRTLVPFSPRPLAHPA